ncbi:MAG TPA: hypothetical protein VFX85_00115 [Solirubrobacterales bacterium]|nr:hypothetical protein [Solirubrobacterales bacterium]
MGDQSDWRAEKLEERIERVEKEARATDRRAADLKLRLDLLPLKVLTGAMWLLALAGYIALLIALAEGS